MKKYRVTLSPEERSELNLLIISGKYKHTRQKRAQILLAASAQAKTSQKRGI